jgi:hypothetical protein
MSLSPCSPPHGPLPHSFPPLCAQAFVNAEEKIVRAERLLLHVIEYDLEVPLPWPHIRPVTDRLGAPEGVAKVAVKTVNDFVRMTLTLQYTAEQLAQASVVLAARICKWPLPPHAATVVTLPQAAITDVFQQFFEWANAGKVLAQGLQAGGSGSAGGAAAAAAASSSSSSSGGGGGAGSLDAGSGAAGPEAPAGGTATAVRPSAAAAADVADVAGIGRGSATAAVTGGSVGVAGAAGASSSGADDVVMADGGAGGP